MTIGLIVLVCSIWGAVLSKAVDRRAPKAVRADDPPMEKNMITRADSIPDIAQLGRYRDPFLGDRPTDRKETVAAASSFAQHRASTPAPTAPMSARAWPRIAYLGCVRRTNADRAVALLTVDDRRTMLLQGTEENGLSLVVVRDDSVVIAFAGEQRAFHR